MGIQIKGQMTPENELTYLRSIVQDLAMEGPSYTGLSDEESCHSCKTSVWDESHKGTCTWQRAKDYKELSELDLTGFDLEVGDTHMEVKGGKVVVSLPYRVAGTPEAQAWGKEQVRKLMADSSASVRRSLS